MYLVLYLDMLTLAIQWELEHHQHQQHQELEHQDKM